MTMRRFRLAAALAAVSALLALPLGRSWADPVPDGQITEVHTQPGVVQFLFSAGDLPDGAVLDPHSVVVTVGSQTLDASASRADAAVEPRRAVIREVVIALDVSGSMKGDGIAAAKAAALSYARGLPADVRVGLVTFASKPTVVLRPTTDRGAIATALSKVSAGGNTALYDGVVAAADVMKRLPTDAQRRLLILSDGEDTTSRDTIADVTSAVVKGEVAADVVAFRLPGSQRSLEQIAAASQGRVLPANNAEGLASAFSAAAKAFRQQVLVTVEVPKALANQTAELTTTLNAGGASVAAKARVTFPFVPGANGAPREGISAPAAEQSHTQLWITVGISFVALLSLALLALLLPVLRHERAQKGARLAEMMRYRVVGVAGESSGPMMPIQQASSRTAITQRALSIADRTVRARGRREGLVSDLDRAGIRIRPEEWAVIQVAAVLVGAAALVALTRSPIWMVVGGVLGWAGVRFFIRHKISRRAADFEKQLPDTLQLLSGSLRTGFSFNQALTSVMREGTEPTASEFARTLTEVRLGAELEDALDDTAERMRCEDLRWVVIAIRISREVGGNLAEVLAGTARTMRERAELRGLVRVLSAEGRISARILIGLPFVVAGFLLLFKPGYLDPLFHTAMGAALLVLGAVLLSVGAFWLSRLVKIEV
jgi:tight adherence protein B